MNTVLHVVGINIKSHDFPFRVDRINLGLLGTAVLVGHINRREEAVVQHKVSSASTYIPTIVPALLIPSARNRLHRTCAQGSAQERCYQVSLTELQFPNLYRFSLEQYYELGELGLLDRRTELLDGIITDMEPISPWHANIGDIFPAFSMNKPKAGSGSVLGALSL